MYINGQKWNANACHYSTSFYDPACIWDKTICPSVLWLGQRKQSGTTQWGTKE